MTQQTVQGRDFGDSSPHPHESDGGYPLFDVALHSAMWWLGLNPQSFGIWSEEYYYIDELVTRNVLSLLSCSFLFHYCWRCDSTKEEYYCGYGSVAGSLCCLTLQDGVYTRCGD
jgi:hypothetical protein